MIDPSLNVRVRRAEFLSKAYADIDELPYTLIAPLTYASVVLDQVIRIPAGFKTDLYSTYLRWFPFIAYVLPRNEGHANAASIVHDYCYQFGRINGITITQKQADQVLQEAMKVKGLAAWRRVLIYRGLRIGGWKAWDDYRRRDAGQPPELAA